MLQNTKTSMATTLKYSRREAHEVTFGGVKIGSTHPIAVQSMTNTPTADVALSVEQRRARLSAQSWSSYAKRGALRP